MEFLDRVGNALLAPALNDAVAAIGESPGLLFIVLGSIALVHVYMKKIQWPHRLWEEIEDKSLKSAVRTLFWVRVGIASLALTVMASAVVFVIANSLPRFVDASIRQEISTICRIDASGRSATCPAVPVPNEVKIGRAWTRAVPQRERKAASAKTVDDGFEESYWALVENVVSSDSVRSPSTTTTTPEAGSRSVSQIRITPASEVIKRTLKPILEAIFSLAGWALAFQIIFMVGLLVAENLVHSLISHRSRARPPEPPAAPGTPSGPTTPAAGQVPVEAEPA